MEIFNLKKNIFNNKNEFLFNGEFINLNFYYIYKKKSKTLIELRLTIDYYNGFYFTSSIDDLKSNYIKIKDIKKLNQYTNRFFNLLLNNEEVLKFCTKEYLIYSIYTMFIDNRLDPNDIFTDEFLNSDILCRALIRGGRK